MSTKTFCLLSPTSELYIQWRGKYYYFWNERLREQDLCGLCQCDDTILLLLRQVGDHRNPKLTLKRRKKNETSSDQPSVVDWPLVGEELCRHPWWVKLHWEKSVYPVIAAHIQGEALM